MGRDPNNVPGLQAKHLAEYADETLRAIFHVNALLPDPQTVLDILNHTQPAPGHNAEKMSRTNFADYTAKHLHDLHRTQVRARRLAAKGTQK